MFYQDEVISQLGEGYEVYSPKENCRFSSYVLNSLRFWLDEFPTPDIIHFNAGLWDSAILYPEDGCFVGLSEYEKNMRAILRELKKTGAKVIFATTTPVSDEKAELSGSIPPAHKNSDIGTYNRAVLEMLDRDEVAVNDLFALMYPEKEKYLSEDMIHPNEDGVKLLGTAVADAIKKCGVCENNKALHGTSKEVMKDQKTMQ